MVTCKSIRIYHYFTTRKWLNWFKLCSPTEITWWSTFVSMQNLFVHIFNLPSQPLLRFFPTPANGTYSSFGWDLAKAPARTVHSWWGRSIYMEPSQVVQGFLASATHNYMRYNQRVPTDVAIHVVHSNCPFGGNPESLTPFVELSLCHWTESLSATNILYTYILSRKEPRVRYVEISE